MMAMRYWRMRMRLMVVRSSIALGAHLNHLLWCSGEERRAKSVAGTRRIESHILSVLIRTSGLVDVHPILVLPSGTRCGTLACILLLPHTFCGFLEYHVQSFL